MSMQNGTPALTGSACPEKATTNLQGLIEPVARLLLGDPNVALSKPTVLRYGSNGSLAVDLDKGVWHDHEEGIGGGVLDLISKCEGITTRHGQLNWLEKNRLKEQKATQSPASPNVLANRRIDTTYEYKDENGSTLFEVVRGEPKSFRQRKPDGNGGWIWSVKGVRQVPFHLPQLIEANPSQQVFIVEGEKDVIRLESLGLVATCNAGGAGKWRDELSKHFAGRSVVILPDNDEPGRKHADKVAHALGMVEADVRVIALPGLPPKGDVSDWLDAGGTVAQLLELMATPCNHLPEEDAPTEQHVEPGDEDDEKKSQASLLVKFVEQRFELFHDSNKDVFVCNRKTGEVRSLASQQFRDCLVAGFYMDTGKSPRDQSIREALTTLTGLGRFHGELRDVHLRTAGGDGEYWLDLAAPGSSRAVRLRAGRWEIAEEVEVAFVRPESMQQLPEPIPGGSLDALWKVANVPPGSRLLALTWLIECLRPETPFPVMELLGEQGSAKSTTQTALRRLIDPNACDLRGAPRTVEDVFVSAGACAMVSYENISHLSAPMQDALCVLSTGGGFAKRKLYSDAEESVITVKRPIILNGISAAVTAQDLVDRAITIETPVITVRQEVTGLWREYEESRPHLLGALLDIAAKALAILPNMRIPADDRPRLLEFALLGMAVAKAVGHAPEDFMQEFNACRQESLARTIDASPVAAAVVDMIAARPQGVTAPVKEILLTLEQYRPSGCDSWPRSPKGLGDALRRAAPALRQLDIVCKCLGKIGGAVKWEIKRKLPKQSPASPEVRQNTQKTAQQQDIRTCRTSGQDLSPAAVASDEVSAEYF